MIETHRTRTKTLKNCDRDSDIKICLQPGLEAQKVDNHLTTDSKFYQVKLAQIHYLLSFAPCTCGADFGAHSSFQGISVTRCDDEPGAVVEHAQVAKYLQNKIFFVQVIKTIKP